MDLEDWPKEQSEQVDRTLQEWKQRGPSLVILDNVQNASAAHKCLSKLGGGQLCVLITTRLDTLENWYFHCPHTLDTSGNR